jgi:DnaA-homolog protein
MTRMKQIPLALGAHAAGPELGFDNFLPGANAAAVDHLRSDPRPATPVYLWGPPASGKTHLLQALARAERAAGRRCGSFSARDAAPWERREDWSLVLIDGCEALDAAQQHAAFALFVDAATAGTAIVAAGRLPPVDLPLREDLRTRLGWGLVFALQPLGEAEVRAVLRREADRRGVLLSDEVMGYLLTRFERDLHHLMDRLDRLDEFSLVYQRAITVPMLKQMLAEESAP